MSDYMFMLEGHLNAEQSRVVREVQAAAQAANLSVFLTGGALRDMLGGFPIREIDFTVEGNALKLGKALEAKGVASIVHQDDSRKVVELLFPGGVRASVGAAKTEKLSKPGAKPQVQAASIHEDLRGRDFTINSIALALHPGSRGLLLDPNNGVGDLHNKELRTVGKYTLSDDPVRLLRLQRFRVRLGFTIGERTQAQYENAREGGLESRISAGALRDELGNIAEEANLEQLIETLDQEKLLIVFSPAFNSSRLNLQGLHKLQKAKAQVPPGTGLPYDAFALLLAILTEKFTPKEKSELAAHLEMPDELLDRWHKLESRAKKLETSLKSAKLTKPSLIFATLSKAPLEQTLFLMLRSNERLVQDRIRNYLTKYVQAAQEITDADVAAAGGVPGTPKGEKLRAELTNKRLDARPKKIPPPVEPEPAPPGPPPGPVRSVPSFGRKI